MLKIYELNNARNCLRIIIRTYGIKKIFIPYYICPAIWQACRSENCLIKPYHINKNFYPTYNFNKDAYILYPNYFGICSANVFKLSNLYPNLIVDNAHAMYMPHCGIASFNSYRKFLPCKDGAKLYIKKEIPTLTTDIYTYHECLKNYNDFVKNELRINKLQPQLLSICTKNIISNINLENEKQERLNLFYKLHKKYSQTNELKINLAEFDVPFIYPYLSDYDVNDNIIRYWSGLPKHFPEYDFYKRLKPIPLKNHAGYNTDS